MTRIKYHLIKPNDSGEQLESNTIEVHWLYKVFILFLIVFFIIYANYLIESEKQINRNNLKINTDYSNSLETRNATGISILKVFKNYSNAALYILSKYNMDFFPTPRSIRILNYTTNLTRILSNTMTNIPPNINKIILEAIEANDRRENDKYFINTSQCHIPYVDPFTPELLNIYKPFDRDFSPNCTHDEAIVEVDFDTDQKYYTLHINYQLANAMLMNKTLQETKEELTCCYKVILRAEDDCNIDNSYKLLPCTIFHQDFIVPRYIDGIIVQCFLKGMHVIQEDAFTFIQVNQTDSENTSKTKLKRKVSFLLIGIDSLSRINVRRTMPQTVNYLKNKNWFELRGYNKVGDNTFPNLMPLLTGYTGDTAMQKCHLKEIGGLDNCNFIWTKFKEQHYKTAYAEDTSYWSTFFYLLKGFEKPPTDYYYRPFAMAIEENMNTTWKASIRYCIGRKQSGQYVYDYAREFSERHQNGSYFGLFWTNSFSHNGYYLPAEMDSSIMEYLQDLEKRGILETSIVAFFSDHGRRWGELLDLPEGYLEERIPMFYISLPKWFQAEYPELVNNLKINQKRLTTPFDIHATMQHLIHLGNSSYEIVPAYDCANARSIFEAVPENRTCSDACIPQTWCTCKPFATISVWDETAKNVTEMIIDQMNDYFAGRNLTELCSKLNFKEVLRAQIRLKDGDTPASSSSSSEASDQSTYMIKFSTYPETDPTAEFSATVNFDKPTAKISLNVEDISRQTKYENTAKCTDDKIAKKYCICKDAVIK